MAIASLPITLLLLFVVKVQCRTAPYVSFMDQTLANHSYVDISQVGTGSAALQCHTDLSTCCAEAKDGTHHGDWYFPNGDRLPIAGSTDSDIIEVHKDHEVELLHSSDNTKPT